MRFISIIAPLSLVLLAACANPIMAKPFAQSDLEKDCATLKADISQTMQLKKDARYEDRAQAKYLAIVNGFVSAYRMSEAEEAAQKRLDKLILAYSGKACGVYCRTNQQSSPNRFQKCQWLSAPLVKTAFSDKMNPVTKF